MEIIDYVKGYDSTLSIIDNCIQILKQTNNEETLEHVTKVSKIGVTIAEKYGVDKEKVEIACYLHDISKIIPKEDYIEICENNDIDIIDIERRIPMLLHQKISKLIAEQIFNITDKEILDALESHTTLRDNPSDIDMIVFIADKLSWDDEGTPPFYDCVSSSVEESLEKGSLELINFKIDNNMIIMPHPMMIEAKRYLDNH